jgi:hypothetical protein
MKSSCVFPASLVIAGFACLAGFEAVFADPIASATPAGVDSTHTPGDPTTGTNRLLILCGLPGDEEHRVLFAGTVDRIREALTTRLGFDPESTTVLFGAEEMQADGGAVPQQAEAPCTLEQLESVTDRLRTSLEPEDTLWVIVIGHAYFDGRQSCFNIPGPDVNQEAFARLFKDLACREMVFWVTTPASGFYIGPLTGEGRVVISATEADREINETIFPHVLADVLAEPPAQDELDADGDGVLTLFDLYITVARRIAQTYVDDNTLSTEHARLEDNGDGRGSEVQRHFLSVELGGQLEEGESPRRLGQTEDGAVAAHIELPGLAVAAPDESVP